MGADQVSAHPAYDDVLMQEVGAMLRAADPVPRDVLLAARDVPSHLSLDDELTELLRAGVCPARRAGR
jgi:hypothetical protein